MTATPKSAPRILIVEDEQITAADIEDILQGLGYRVAGVAPSGEVAIREAERSRPDLILMDIHLQGRIDGIQAACEIRKRFDIPAIYLTAHADDATLARAREAEPLGYIVKPYHERELQAVLQMALHKSRADREASEQREQLSSTLESIGEGVIRLDSMGRVVFMNPAAEQWTGWKQEDAHERHLSEVFPLLDGETKRSLETYLTQASHASSVISLPRGCLLRSRDGMERAVSGNVAPVRDPSDGVVGAVMAFGRVQSAPSKPSKTDRAGVGSSGDLGSTAMVVAAPVMRELMRFTERIAGSGVTAILLLGESGTGKDVLARYLHARSKRADKPFLAVNCAAIPETLVESELFGYEKGAFTDARAQKKGVFDLADGGTVFLDEIGDLQPHLQAKLLRVLEEQTFRRLGGVRDIAVDLRIVTATNKNLRKAVLEGEFREDLYYRLNVIQIAIPPIRDRREDILPIVRFFIDRYNMRFEREIEGVSDEAGRLLQSYDWPGNVREIRNVVERAMVLADDNVLQPQNLSLGSEELAPVTAATAAPAPEPPPPPGAASLDEVERGMLVQALEKCGGNQTRAAKMLGVTRDTLRYRIKKHGLR